MKEIQQYTITNKLGTSVEVLNLGAIIRSIGISCGTQPLTNVVLGYDELDDYRTNPYYLGTVVGRFANRINQGRFVLDGKQYQVTLNNGKHHIHGGHKGLHSKFWKVSELQESMIRLTTVCHDGEDGFPGNLEVAVTYTLSDLNELSVDFHAITDKDTIVNLTQHSYFNLSGNLGQGIEDHIFRIDSDRCLEVDAELIPTGNLLNVDNSIFDFRKPFLLKDKLQNKDGTVLKDPFDNCYEWSGNPNKAAVTVFHPTSKIELEVFTTFPGVHFYTGNNLDEPFVVRGGFCIEAQNYPDAPNHPHFPNPILKVGEVYRHSIKYRFNHNNALIDKALL